MNASESLSEQCAIRHRAGAAELPTRAGGHVIALALRDTSAAQRHSWATDMWADAVYDIVHPLDAEWPAIDAALVVFEDVSCLVYARGEPREVSLSGGLRAMASLNRTSVACLLRSPIAAVRVAALSQAARRWHDHGPLRRRGELGADRRLRRICEGVLTCTIHRVHYEEARIQAGEGPDASGPPRRPQVHPV